MDIKLIGFLLITFLGFVLITRKGGYRILFWVGILLTFVREIYIPVLGPMNLAAFVFVCLSLANMPNLLRNTSIRPWRYYFIAIITSWLVALIYDVPFYESYNWLFKFAIVYLIAINVEYYVRHENDELALMRAFLLIGFIFSFTAVIAYLGFYDGIIIFGKNSLIRGVADPIITSGIYGISYTNDVMCISAISLVFLPYVKIRNIFKLLVIAVTVIGVTISLKRVAIIALILSLSYCLLREIKNKNIHLVFGVFVLLFFSSGGLISKEILTRFMQSVDTFRGVAVVRESSVSIRMSRIDWAWSEFLKHPILGVGAGRLIYIHNGFLEILANCGLIGFGLFSPLFSVLSFKWMRIFINPWAIAVVFYFATLFMFEAAINRVDLMYFLGIAYGGYLSSQKLTSFTFYPCMTVGSMTVSACKNTDSISFAG